MKGKWIPNLALRLMSGAVTPREAVAFLMWRANPSRTSLTIEGVHFQGVDRATWGLITGIILNREYNPPGFEIGPRDVVIDIGAHRGVFLGHAAMQTKARVVGIEPEADNFRILGLMVRRNLFNNVELIQAAVAGASGESRLFRGLASSRHTLTGVDIFSGEALAASQAVRTISLDDLCQDIPMVDFLKMDCEGAEHEIIRSASDETLMKIRRLVMEVHELASPVGSEPLLDRLAHSFSRLQYKMTSEHMGVLYAIRQ
jgi:FkbM family methyltransferase